MASRFIRLARAVACTSLLVVAPLRAAPVPVGISAYRAYAASQAELLARMTRMLAKDIRDGDVKAAQNDYAATHRYLERIRPVLAGQRELAKRMDGAAEEYPDGPRDPAFSGFHRIEHGLFALKSTQGLPAYADRLYEDALGLQEAVATQPMAFTLLVDGPARLIEIVSARALDGGREPYAQTDLWDIEANVDGAREMVAAIRPQIEARDPLAMTRIATAFAQTSERLAQLRDGCGFKSFDQLTRAEREGLRDTTATLARELARGTLEADLPSL